MPRKIPEKIKEKIALRERRTRPLVDFERRVYDSMRKYFNNRGKGGITSYYKDILWEAKERIGSLRGKKTLMIAAEPTFASYLREIEGADVTSYNSLVQIIERMPESGFDLVLANRVFERGIFLYKGLTHTRVKEVMDIEDFQKEKKLESLTVHELERRNARIQREKERALERVDILKKFASKLSSGGYFILTGSGRTTIFKPREATRAGFKIIKMNELCRLGRYATVLQKK